MISSRALDAGSARGYGTLQSMGATEMLVDEVAAELQLDPIELRQRNVFASGMKNTQGAIPAGAQRADEVLARCRAHPLWQQRATRKREYEAAHPGKRYGVGFGCVQKDFGTGAEAAFAEVALARDGQLLLRHIGIDMGTGMATSQAALCVRWLGRPADEVRTGETEWPELPMFAHRRSLADEAGASRTAQAGNPRWTPYYGSAAAAPAIRRTSSATRRARRRALFSPRACGPRHWRSGARVSAAASSHRWRCGARTRAGSMANSPPAGWRLATARNWSPRRTSSAWRPARSCTPSIAGNGRRPSSRSIG